MTIGTLRSILLCAAIGVVLATPAFAQFHPDTGRKKVGTSAPVHHYIRTSPERIRTPQRHPRLVGPSEPGLVGTDRTGIAQTIPNWGWGASSPSLTQRRIPMSIENLCGYLVARQTMRTSGSEQLVVQMQDQCIRNGGHL